MKNILIISESAPINHTEIRESLDMALIFAAIDQEVSWLFRGPAVLALSKHIDPESLGIKNYFKQLKTLEIYDVENIYICSESASLYGLDPDALSIKAKQLTIKEQTTLLNSQTHVVTL